MEELNERKYIDITQLLCVNNIIVYKNIIRIGDNKDEKCISMEDDKENIPDPSRITELDISSGTFVEEGETIVSFVDVDSAEYRRKIDTRTVRRNVALPSWLNYEAERAGVNVSRILQEALISTLHLKRKI
jgi:toxin-antitoxin system, antitoxin component, hicB family